MLDRERACSIATDKVLELYTTSISRCNAPRCAFPDTRFHRARSILQPSNLARSKCAEPAACASAFSTYAIGKLNWAFTSRCRYGDLGRAGHDAAGDGTKAEEY
jgi:hypothetical protein